MALHAVSDVSPEWIMAIKQATKQAMLDLIKSDTGAAFKETDWIFRETVFGIGTPAGIDAPFVDLSWASVGVTGSNLNPYNNSTMQAFSYTPFSTLNKFMPVLASGSTIPTNKYVGAFGAGDWAPVRGALGTTGTITPSNGNLQYLKFAKTGTMDIWDFHQLYDKPVIMGITDRPIIWGETTPIDIQASVQRRDGVNAVIRAFTAEKNARALTWTRESKDVIVQNDKYGYNVGNNFVRHIPGGCHPIQELSRTEINRIKSMTIYGLRKMIIDAGKSSWDRIADTHVIREVRVGAGTTMPDPVDLRLNGYITDPQVGWNEVSTLFSASVTPYNMISTTATEEYGTVAEGKAIGVFGLFDRGGCPQCYNTLFDTSGVKAFWDLHAAYCYPTLDVMTDVPVFFNSKDTVKWYLTQRGPDIISTPTVANQAVGLRAYIIEPWNKTISKE